jgi:hypothetical protein
MPLQVWLKTGTKKDAWTFVGRTETIDDTSNPAWQSHLILHVFPEQELKFIVLDDDEKDQHEVCALS